MNLQENIRRILSEEISAKEAYGSYGSIKTIIDGKRDVAFIELNNIVNRLLISLKSLKKIKVPSSTETNYIVYREGSEKEAQELYDIAMKYGGVLSYDASEEDSIRIGQILGYKQDDIEDYIKHNKKIKGITENIQRIREMMEIPDMNILDEPLQICGKDPMTGYYRDGYCKTGSSDKGTHTVCSEVDDEFLEFTKSKGNDLSMLKSGDRWCLCANRWKEAYDAGKAPKVIKNATNKKTLDVIGDDIKDEELTEYARTLKNARQQGVGLRFPKSAIKSNPARFRPYNRK